MDLQKLMDHLGAPSWVVYTICGVMLVIYECVFEHLLTRAEL